MILVDTSAWVEYLRKTGSAEHHRLRELIEAGAPLATTEVVVMELLAGAGTQERYTALRRLLSALEFLPIIGLAEYESAADLYRFCRRQGQTIRKMTDCLIAIVALRTGSTVLHRDSDFAAMATCGGLQVEPATF
ncbi:MAG: type II toxin-antitoxin system VapC family toxin [Chloroflexota bacterium]